MVEDYNLDPRLEYTKVTNISDKKYLDKIVVTLSDGTTKNVNIDEILTSGVTNIKIFYKNIPDRNVYDSPIYVSANVVVRVKAGATVKNGDSLTNMMRLTGKRVDGTSIGEFIDQGNLLVKAYDPSFYIINNGSLVYTPNVYLNDTVRLSSNFYKYNFRADHSPEHLYVNILVPDGLEPTSIQSTTKVTRNFNNTSKTLYSFERDLKYPFYSWDFKVTGNLKKGSSTIETWWTTSTATPDDSLIRYSNVYNTAYSDKDIFDFNSNGRTNDPAGKIVETLNYIPPKELVGIKGVKGNRDKSFSSYSRLEASEPFTYSLQVANNTDVTATDIAFIEKLPHP